MQSKWWWTTKALLIVSNCKDNGKYMDSSSNCTIEGSKVQDSSLTIAYCFMFCLHFKNIVYQTFDYLWRIAIDFFIIFEYLIILLRTIFFFFSVNLEQQIMCVIIVGICVHFGWELTIKWQEINSSTMRDVVQQ